LFLYKAEKTELPPLGNEYFSNAVEEQNKAVELVDYIFPTP